MAIAAGSGITPVLSILKTTLQTEPESQFTLIYGNRDRKSIIFREEIEHLKNKTMKRLQIIHLLSWEVTENGLHYGRIDEKKFEAMCNGLIDLGMFDEFFLCGPEEMIFSVKRFLKAKTLHLAKFTLNSLQRRCCTKKN